ncbi:hypothetical protein MSAN_00483500 [Mycena sanguinolenta]|uniref:Uncharacterized protein n=1 Tax=Mycena sanguinolenta TaxID=230812 RepID=A0A8H7DHU0_9AGAR|nr:hypothetical protein MSAN_00483500 [Mycena sanguinolenta]
MSPLHQPMPLSDNQRLSAARLLCLRRPPLPYILYPSISFPGCGSAFSDTDTSSPSHFMPVSPSTGNLLDLSTDTVTSSVPSHARLPNTGSLLVSSPLPRCVILTAPPSRACSVHNPQFILPLCALPLQLAINDSSSDCPRISSLSCCLHIALRHRIRCLSSHWTLILSSPSIYSHAYHSTLYLALDITRSRSSPRLILRSLSLSRRSSAVPHAMLREARPPTDNDTHKPFN